LLRLLKKQDGKVILSSDSHNVDTLGFYFAEIKQLLRDVGFQYTYTLGENGFEKVAL
jgi:histidinol-phosphatase (PHP family)